MYELILTTVSLCALLNCFLIRALFRECVRLSAENRQLTTALACTK